MQLIIMMIIGRRPGRPGQSRHMSDPDYVEPNEDGEAGVGGTTSKRRQRPRRKRAQADRSALEWQCVTIVRDDDVNPVVQCNFMQFLPVEERRWCNSYSAAYPAHRTGNQVHW